MVERAVLIGTCGWQHPQWRDTYYPEGLPDDWQLAFYGNEYPVVLVPDAYWTQGRNAIAEWLAESEQRPRFVCEWSIAKNEKRPVPELIAALGDRVEGVLISLTQRPDAGQLETIGSLCATYAVCVDWPTASHDELHALLAQPSMSQQVSVCWRGDPAQQDVLTHGRLALARVPSRGQTPRSLRTLLETLLRNAGERQAVLLFDGQPPDLEVVDQAEILLNLL
ncbi:MAG: hypothetical protein GC149_04560 [Gammaproteobacteria bacterium]|nr:hypothetical protein [Gammaproteobacteria bacterium]